MKWQFPERAAKFILVMNERAAERHSAVHAVVNLMSLREALARNLDASRGAFFLPVS